MAALAAQHSGATPTPSCAHPMTDSDPRVPIDLRRAAAELTDLWSPRVVAELNGQYVKVAKVKGEFVWHAHDGEDEMFLVLQGRLQLQFEDRVIELGPGESCVVPRGVRHNPRADDEVLLALFEPKATLHAGGVASDKARSIEEQRR